MGPSFFKDGNEEQRRKEEEAKKSFNGAILFQGWKWVSLSHLR